MIRLLILQRRGGWCIAGNPEEDSPARPYVQRDEAIHDALFAARLLESAGESVSVYVENSDGLRRVPDEDQLVWRTH